MRAFEDVADTDFFSAVGRLTAIVIKCVNKYYTVAQLFWQQ